MEMNPTANKPAAGEITLWSSSYSTKALAGAMILSVLLLLGCSIAALIYVERWTYCFIIIGLAALPELYCLMLVNYRRLTIKYLLTNKRIVCETGLLNFASSRVELMVVNDVGYTQNDLDRLFGIGTVTITSSDASDPTLVLKGVENVKDVVKLLEQTCADERANRGMMVNMGG